MLEKKSTYELYMTLATWVVKNLLNWKCCGFYFCMNCGHSVNIVRLHV